MSLYIFYRCPNWW